MFRILVLALGLSLTAASCNFFSGGGRGVLKSTDAGETFAAANTLADEDGQIAGLSANFLALDPTDPETLYLGSSAGLHKSEDGAASWRHVLEGIRTGSVAVDSVQPQTVYLSGVSGEHGKILKSTDGGETWKDIFTEPTKNNPVLSIAVSAVNSRILLAGLNSGEVLRSTDEGQTWQGVAGLSNPVIKLRYTDSRAYALTRTSGLFASLDQGSSWTNLPLTNVSAPQAVQPGLVTPNFAAAQAFYDAAFDESLSGVIFLASDRGLLRTVDGGTNWSIVSLPVNNQTAPVTAVAVSPADSNDLYIAVGATLFKSRNGGVTWETRPLPSQEPVRHILINFEEPNIIYLGMGTN